MKILYSLTMISILILVTMPEPRAQYGDENIRNIFFDTLTTGEVNPTPIGVDDMKYIGTNIISGSDKLLIRYVTDVVKYDIDFYADFELIMLDSFYMKTYEIKDMDPMGWLRLGADYMVKLEAEFPGNNMRIRWRLFDNARNQQFTNGTLEQNKNSWREMGHMISNEIVRNLTGETGFFLTKIVYATANKKSKEIYLADYDGSNEIQLTNNGSINISPTFSPKGKYIYFLLL